MTDPERPHGFTRRPEPKTIGSPPRGAEILSGTLRLPGGALSGDPFGQDSPGPAFSAALHGFGWLDDLAAVGSAAARELAQARVLAWIAGHARVPQTLPAGGEAGVIWRPDITGRRVLRWVFHAGMILPGLDRDGAQPVFDSLHDQLDYLSRNWPRADQGRSRAEALCTLLIGALALKGAGHLVAPALTTISDEAAQVVEGAMRSRNPEELLTVFSLLVWCADALTEHGMAVPDLIADSIEQVAPTLRALRHADGGLPRFHGGGRGVQGRLDHSLRAAKGPAVTVPGLAMGYARLARTRTTVIVDAAAPPSGLASERAHASTLGLEMTVARYPLVVSCGSGAVFGTAWARASRATPCHSTLCVSGVSSSRLLPPDDTGAERLVELPQNAWAGQADADGNLFAPDNGPAHAGETAQILSAHDGWLPSHGLTHLRELWLSPAGDHLRGEDSLAALTPQAQDLLDDIRKDVGLPFDIRFHLHPHVVARPEGDAVRLTVAGREDWYFSHDMVAELRLEPSVYLEPDQPEPVATQQIVLSGLLTSHAVQIGWTFMRAGAS